MIKIDFKAFTYDHILFGFMRMNWPAHEGVGDVYGQAMARLKATKAEWYKVKNWRPWIFKRIRY